MGGSGAGWTALFTWVIGVGGEEGRMATRGYLVAGVTCGHCGSAVQEELGKIGGVIGVDVDLVAGGESDVRVTSDRAVAEEQVRAAVDEAGYTLVSASG